MSEIIYENNDKILRTSALGIAVYADSSPSPILDLDQRKGWLFHKLLENTDKFNYYIYSNTASNKLFELKDLKSLYMVCNIDTYTNTASVPFIIIYTVPTGVNDAGLWYHSRITYHLDLNTEQVLAGEPVNLFIDEKPHLRNNNRYIKLKNKIISGDGLENEPILTIALHCDSSSPINTKILVSDAGYTFNTINKISKNIEFVG